MGGGDPRVVLALAVPIGALLGVLELERLGTNPETGVHEQELIDAALGAASYADKLAVAAADPDAEIVLVNESETMGGADAREGE